MRKGAKLSAEHTNKTKDLTLGGKMSIPRREMWYSPACPLSALRDLVPAALHSSVSSLKSELQESVKAGHAAPALLLVLPVKAMLSHHRSDATLRGQRLPRQQQTERQGHPAGLPTEVQNPGVPEHAKQNLNSCKEKLYQKMDKQEVLMFLLSWAVGCRRADPTPALWSTLEVPKGQGGEFGRSTTVHQNLSFWGPPLSPLTPLLHLIALNGSLKI